MKFYYKNTLKIRTGFKIFAILGKISFLPKVKIIQFTSNRDSFGKVIFYLYLFITFLNKKTDIQTVHSNKLKYKSTAGIKGQLSGHSSSPRFLLPFVFFILQFDPVTYPFVSTHILSTMFTGTCGLWSAKSPMSSVFSLHVPFILLL